MIFLKFPLSIVRDVKRDLRDDIVTVWHMVLNCDYQEVEKVIEVRTSRTGLTFHVEGAKE
jgi:hypothetical protein